MKNIKTFVVLIFSILLFTACKNDKNYSKIETKTNTNQASKVAHKIQIIESLDGGNYTYIYVNEDEKKYWMAISKAPVSVGEIYYYDNGMVMKNFESKELERTFNSITFADKIRTSEKATKVERKDPHVGTDKVTQELEKIEQPEGGTVLELIFSDKKSFEKKNILVRGKVVKVNNGILDKNWIHIADGSQFDGKKSLTVTTNEFVKVGDTVTFRGSITLDKDFGYGYVYDILLENGELIK
ncbi:MAG: DNA-binding protein [Lutibacter sp.]|uniref:hypothetical protein n=1 Tax=Lutibacter sp. TaxID=1925666 RepID=UPI0017C9C3E9|nr:hypothetical protein [Lutibacter sp.]MBT8316165.1 hypothetical protein [Lutibacter sp.]NNJ57025.1 DNA-binding protein [Lutibacter sp.]